MPPLHSLLSIIFFLFLSFALTAPSDPKAPLDFVILSDIDPTILHDIRYHTPHNFIGTPITGYLEPLCIITQDAAYALKRVQSRVRRKGYTLKIYDCYRPQRAVDHFIRWAKDLEDTKMKKEFYPTVDKKDLFALGFIAEKSGHSRGSTVDLTLVKLPPQPQRPYIPGEKLVECTKPYGVRFPDNSIDMATGYDCFDELSHAVNPKVKGFQKMNRALLNETMSEEGFRVLAEEWWHFTLRDELFPGTFFDFPVLRKSIRKRERCDLK